MVEHEEGGGGVYWNPDVDAGTLRLDLITFKRSGSIPKQSAVELLQSLSGDGIVSELSHGNAVRVSTSSAEEDGSTIKQYYWELVNFVGQNHFRLAVFSYTILASQENDPVVVAELKILNESLRVAEFSSELGV